MVSDVPSFPRPQRARSSGAPEIASALPSPLPVQPRGTIRSHHEPPLHLARSHGRPSFVQPGSVTHIWPCACTTKLCATSGRRYSGDAWSSSSLTRRSAHTSTARTASCDFCVALYGSRCVPADGMMVVTNMILVDAHPRARQLDRGLARMKLVPEVLHRAIDSSVVPAIATLGPYRHRRSREGKSVNLKRRLPCRMAWYPELMPEGNRCECTLSTDEEVVVVVRLSVVRIWLLCSIRDLSARGMHSLGSP
ncbi:hypothetical protein C8T65DRAFT_645970 [Cerioporus squamosus]|nr:hypothetical protein C8T65DRAFT_645970 [Cerioporus squamosus]